MATARAPRRPSSIASARPIPEPAPVTAHTLSLIMLTATTMAERGIAAKRHNHHRDATRGADQPTLKAHRYTTTTK